MNKPQSIKAVKRLFRILGVDYTQFRALVRTSIRLDFRVAAIRSTFRQHGSGGSRALIGLILMAAFISIFFSVLVWLSRDVFSSGTVLVTYVMCMVGATVLIDFHSVVISPDDYAILGYHPISSRTYLAARLVNVLFYTSIITTALGALPIACYFFCRGFNPLLGLAALLATYLASTGSTLAMILAYVGILRWVHPNKLRRALSYLQLAMSFFIYGGYIFMPDMVNKRLLATMSFRKSPWLLLHPATWFASYLDLSIGRWGWAEILPALASFGTLGSLVACAAGRLTLDYSERLSSLTATSEDLGNSRPRSARELNLLFRQNEARAVALLIRNQFKRDQRFRLAVLGILPLTILYLYMGLRGGPLQDPFVGTSFDAGLSLPLYLAILIFPIMLKTSLTSSDSFQASWIFFASPADKGRLVRSVKNFVMAYFVFPYLMFLGLIFLYYFHNLAHAVLHLMILALFSHIFLQLAFLISPELPFSRPVKRTERPAGFVAFVVMGSVAAALVLPLLFTSVYPNPKLLIVLLCGLAATSLLIELAVASRIDRRVRKLQYAG